MTLFRTGKFRASTLALILLLLSQTLFAQMPSEKLPKALYSFQENLVKAHALRRGEGGGVEGMWQEGRFRFEGQPETSEIRVTDVFLVEEKSRSAISFPPVSGFQSHLVFSRVPPARRLRLFFALPDTAFEPKALVPVEFEVWIGRKRLLRTTVSTPGWNRKTFDLTLPFLLQRTYRIRFQVRQAAEGPANLLFYGQLE